MLTRSLAAVLLPARRQLMPPASRSKHRQQWSKSNGSKKPSLPHPTCSCWVRPARLASQFLGSPP